jgi:hypothetical protein
MTNPRPQKPTEDILQPPRRGNVAGDQIPDACELLIAELEARRVRLQQLLRLVRLEAESALAKRAALRPRARCSHMPIKRTA